MLDLALAHLPVEYWLSYLDDILYVLYGYQGPPEAPEEHCGGSHQGRDQDSTQEDQIFQTETEYLGHKVSQGGVQMLD